MRILILNLRDHTHPSAGGAEVFTHEVAKRWVAHGHAVTLIASNFAGGAPTEVIDGITIIRLGNYLTVRSRARAYYRKHLRGNCDLVVDEYTNIPFLAPRFVQEPVIFLVHEVVGAKHLAVLPPGIGHLMHYFMEPRWYACYRNVDTVTVSNSTRDDLLQFGITATRIVPQGLSQEPLEGVLPKEDVPTFLFVGLLKKANLVHDCITAFKIIKSKIPEARLWIVGRGAQRDKLEARLTVSLSPTLCAMLLDPLLQDRYERHLRELVELAEKEIHRLPGEADDDAVGPGAVRDAGVVPQVEVVVAGQYPEEFPEHHEPAEAGIKDPDHARHPGRKVPGRQEAG